MTEEIKKHYNTLVLKKACVNYGINIEKVKLIRDNINLVFDAGDTILRLSHSSIRTKTDIETEIDWLFFLREKGLPVVEILSSKDQKHLVQIGEEDNHFSCVCFKKIEGKVVTKEEWNPLHYEKLGSLTGILHREGQKYVEKQELKYQDWNEAPEFEITKYLPKDERHLLQLHDTLVKEFLTYPKTKSTYGLIHYDIHHGNYLLVGSNKKLILFDFEMVCKSWYVNDIAAVLHYASLHTVSQNTENFDFVFLENFWKGYEREYTLSKTEKMKIPKFALYRTLMVYSFLHEAYTTDEQKKSIQFYFDDLSRSIEKRRRALNL